MPQPDPGSSPAQGLLKILRFNWPWYAGALALNAIACLLFPSMNGLSRMLGSGVLLLTDAWLAASLAISHWIYDRSSLTSGGWLHGIDKDPARIAILHAGHDEASLAVHRRFLHARVEAFDFFDPSLTPEPSLARARGMRLEPSPALPLDLRNSGSLPAPVDLACAVFTAHELRKARPRAALFLKVAMSLSPKGLVIVVEHLRDAWNFAAYGPGCLHFLPRSAWEDTFRAAGLRLVEERKLTPFVSVFILEAR